MKGLKCTTANCEHNHSCHCGAGIVNVDRNGVCRTKQKRGLGMLGQAFEAAQDFALTSDENTLVQCDCTECVYNKSRLCCASAVTIRDSAIRTRCTTRRE